MVAMSKKKARCTAALCNKLLANALAVPIRGILPEFKLKNWGRPSKDGQTQKPDVIRLKYGSTGAPYLLARLQRDFENGELN